MCLCIAPITTEEKRDHFGTIAVDVHRMFHHDSTALTTLASGLGWISAGLPHIQGVHRNLRTNPVGTQITHSKSEFALSMLRELFVLSTMDSTDRCLVLSPSTRVVQFPCEGQG